MAFWTPQGLSRLAQSESGGRADLVHYPSGYTKSGVRSSASGLYGFLDSTWRQQAGPEIASQYPRAYMAPADIQTQVAANTPISHWTCPGCNSTATRLARDPQYVSASPSGDASSYGDYGGGGSGGELSGAGVPGRTGLTVDPEGDPGPGPGQSQPTYDPSSYGDYGGGGMTAGGSGVPDELGLAGGGLGGLADLAGAAAGLAGGSGSSQGGGLPAVGTWISTQLVRIALIGAGLVLIAAAAWSLARQDVMPALARATK